MHFGETVLFHLYYYLPYFLQLGWFLSILDHRIYYISILCDLISNILINKCGLDGLIILDGVGVRKILISYNNIIFS